MKNILVIGANSAIAKAVSRLYAEEHCRLYLLARDSALLAQLKQDLEIRGAAEVDFAPLDVTHFSLHEAVLEQALDTLAASTWPFSATAACPIRHVAPSTSMPRWSSSTSML